ncbi:MAG: hypothetical protein KY455_09570 [Euryarchaeota archaeon]|nr:hypothetical protein [Euryarchaeota archaeon]
MSAPTTHLAVGVLFGLVGLFLLRERDGPVASPMQVFNVLLWSAIAAAAPDLDTVIGAHRATFTNIWVGFVLPAALASVMATMPGARHPFFRATIPVLPALFGSHLFFDLYGYTNRHAQVLWPFSETRYHSPQVVDIHAYGGYGWLDAGFPLFAFVLFFVAYGWGHARVGAWLREAAPEERRWAVPVFVAAATLLALLPFALVWWGGLLYT